jgi:cytochrome c nitrite reductase small subunit
MTMRTIRSSRNDDTRRRGSGFLLSRPLALLAGLVGLLGGVGAYTFYYAQGFSYLSNNPEVCINCHIMRDQYDGWLKAGHHAHATCNDCHLPHGLAGKYLAKAENGFRHSKAFTFQDFPEPIRIRPGNARILNENCRDCHARLVRGITAHVTDTRELDCVRCHDSVGHGPPR